MTLMLGIDTGGTFTDAVLLDDDGAVVAVAKSPTTHHDLTIGVAAAVRRALDTSVVGETVVDDIGLVSISTTLATNALVEGHGDSAGLVTFGFSERELERAGIAAAVPANVLVRLAGGHDAHGNERSPLDRADLAGRVSVLAEKVTAIAVAAQFSVRNPAYELAAADVIRETTGLPVTCSHELSARLDGPRRALTAALNARLLGTIDRLHDAVKSVMADLGIEAPLMVVRGDGSLVAAEFAASRPIETVLSGPAASVIGALHLCDLANGVVADMGGTTTDVAVVANGRPAVTAGGAVVGEHRTMVEAVDMATMGIGGDSEVRIDVREPNGPVLVGPERAIPMCRLVADHPGLHRELDAQLAAPVGLTSHGRFLVATAVATEIPTDPREAEVLRRLRDGPLAVSQAATTGLEQRAAGRLQARGLVRVATMTPTDGRCVLEGEAFELGTAEHAVEIDHGASVKVATLLARQSAAGGAQVAENAQELAEMVTEEVVSSLARFVAQVALGVDGIDHRGASELVDASLRNHRGVTAPSVALTGPLTGIGAPAGAYIPSVAERLRTAANVPELAGVANAVGAVVGRVRIRQSATITQPSRGQFRVHLDEQPTFGSVENARAEAAERLRITARTIAAQAGADTPELSERWDEHVAEVSGKSVFVEGTLTIEASGRPRF